MLTTSPLEIRGYFPAEGEYFAYFDPAEPHTYTKALDDLENYLSNEGPFDGVLAYSHGAQLAAGLLARSHGRNSHEQPFKCAVFLSGGVPYHFSNEKTVGRQDVNGRSDVHLVYMDPLEVGELVQIPTANIWGRNDLLYPGKSETLSRMCRRDLNSEFVHDGGHDIPSAKAKEDLFGCVRTVRRAVDCALTMQ